MTLLFIRADADGAIGCGHIMRSLALAQACLKRGGQVVFVSRCESERLQRRIVEEGCHLVTVERSHPDENDLKTTLSILKEKSREDGKSWAVLDGYHFDFDFQRAVLDTGFKTLVIDDHNHLPMYAADIILNQNIGAEQLPYNCRKGTVMLLGKSYVLLRNEFLSNLLEPRAIGTAARRILVTLGGADPNNVTLKVVQAIALLGVLNLNVTVVLGPLNLNKKIIEREMENAPFECRVLTEVEDMSPLMRWADLAVSAGGSSCWELAYMGVPFLVLILSDNQEGIARGLAADGAAINCGWFNRVSVTTLATYLEDAIRDGERLESCARRARQIVDGFGRERVLNIMAAM
jgi:UDP-2,4-diacetamido-2,4,6-trideoxy-beta-L-altropyranose hydrolase